MRSRSIAFGVVAVLLLSGSAGAHHNMSAYFDFNNRVMITGTLSKIDWRNPHIELIVDTKDGEQVKPYRLEGPAPGFFRDRDISKEDIDAALGKPVTAEASGARDGSPWGLLRTMTLPSGKLVSACPQIC